MHLLITAGPSQEPIDAVRFIGNRSSGRMGIAIAAAAAEAGHRVTLLLGPVAVTPPSTVETLPFRTAADLQALLREHAPKADLLIMAAAVADYRPKPSDVESLRTRKIERASELTLHLEAVPDLLAEVAQTARADQRIVGFALEEPTQLEERARTKLLRKRIDAIVANPLATMDAAGVAGVLLVSPGDRGAAAEPETRRPPNWPQPIAKDAFARWLVAELPSLWR
jgi:phosphopantothenoylcysteine decarboxylase / phosphopantothenate---cysteine ligase